MPYDRNIAARLGNTLGEADLRHLIRGLVRYPSMAGAQFSGGSASPVIPLYTEFVARYPHSEPELTTWIVRNRVNDYEPFGTIMNAGALSLQEHNRLRQKRWEQAKINLQAQQDIADRSREKAAQEATDRLPNAVRRGDIKALKAMLEKRADPQAASEKVGSLRALAKEFEREDMAQFLSSKGID